MTDRQDQVGGQKSSSVARSVLEVVGIVAAAFVLALLIQQFLVKPFSIPSGSMEPTLTEGDRVLVARFVYHFADPKVGDIVVFHPPSDPSQDFIKRVVAVGGQTVEVRDGSLYVDGKAVDEPFIKEHPIQGSFGPVTVRQGELFMMGDNRNESGDSRFFGAVSEDEVVGRAFMVYWPLGKIAVL